MGRNTVPAEGALREALEVARTSWPELHAPEALFAEALGRATREQTASRSSRPASLHVADLYLACACLAGVPGAVEALDRQYRPSILRALGRLGLSNDRKDEIVQHLLPQLLVPEAGRAPALAEYAARAPLGSWLAIVAQRLALNARRAEATRHRLLDRLAAEPRAPVTSAESRLLRRRHARVFREALRAAVEELPERDRVVLRLSLVGRMTTVRIAKMYGVDQATASRWLTGARRKIWSAVEKALRKKLGLGLGETRSLLRDLAGDGDLSLSSVLGPRPT